MVAGDAEYCPYCGTKLSQRELEDRMRRYCEECEEFIFRHSVPCLDTFIMRGEPGDEEVLLIKRKEKPQKGAWNTPGGFPEPEEHTAKAAARELLEETGLRASPRVLTPFGAEHFQNIYDDYILIVAYAAPYKWVSGEPDAATDAAEAEFRNVRDVLRGDDPVRFYLPSLLERARTWYRREMQDQGE